MIFSGFIRDHLEAIIEEWEAFARTLQPSANTMSDSALRDHCSEMLLAIAKEMETRQTSEEQLAKSKALTEPADSPATPAATHGTLRHRAGFDLVQLVAEFRAMRASVLALWHRSQTGAGACAVEEISRFNAAIDNALAASVESYSAGVAKSRDMFLAILGHDLRGPLSAIDMSSLLLGKADLSVTARQQAGLRIRRACKAMNRLVTDLLEYTRSQLGSGIPIERAACDLGPVCEEALDAMRASHPEQQFEQEMGGDLRLEADVPRMQQVLSNLLSNAVQHGDGQAPVWLSACGETDTVVVKVRNSGEPIPAQALQVIFEPLVQLPSAGSDPQEQTTTSLGLGLFIVRQIVHGHGGEVSVQSTADTGTEFTIRLPRKSV